MIDILYLFLGVAIVMANFQLFQAISGKLVGAEIEEIGIFIGSSLFKFNIGSLKVSVNAFPIGCYVKFTDDFENMPPIRKLITVIFGLLSYLILAVVCIGFSDSLQKALSLYGQFIWGAWSPVQVVAKYIEDLAKIMTDNSFVVGLGILAAKMFATNSLPFGTLSGGNVLIYLLELLGFSSEKFSERFNLIGVLIGLPFWLAWTFALIVLCLKNLRVL